MSDMIVKNLSFGNEAKQEVFKGIDYTAEYGVNGVTVYTEVSSDRDWDFGNVTVGMKALF